MQPLRGMQGPPLQISDTAQSSEVVQLPSEGTQAPASQRSPVPQSSVEPQPSRGEQKPMLHCSPALQSVSTTQAGSGSGTQAPEMQVLPARQSLSSRHPVGFRQTFPVQGRPNGQSAAVVQRSGGKHRVASQLQAGGQSAVVPQLVETQLLKSQRSPAAQSLSAPHSGMAKQTPLAPQ